jgi:hypothetical protein
VICIKIVQNSDDKNKKYSKSVCKNRGTPAQKNTNLIFYAIFPLEIAQFCAKWVIF